MHSNSPPILSRLPVEITQHILHQLRNIIDVRRLTKLNKLFLSIINSANSSFWKTLYFSQWHTNPPLWLGTARRHEDDLAEPEKIPFINEIAEIVIDWKSLCRAHAINRIDGATFPGNWPVRQPCALLRLKPSLVGVVYEAGNSDEEHEYVDTNMIRCVRGELPLDLMTKMCDGIISYFEINLNRNARGTATTFGVVTKSFPNRTKSVGWRVRNADPTILSVGFHGDDGRKFSPTDSTFSGVYRWNNPISCDRAIVGCGINWETKEIFFTRDGKFLGIAYCFADDSTEDDYDLASGWFPAAAVAGALIDFDFNFGSDRFAFNFDQSVNPGMWASFGHGNTSALGQSGLSTGAIEYVPPRQ